MKVSLGHELSRWSRKWGGRKLGGKKELWVSGTKDGLGLLWDSLGRRGTGLMSQQRKEDVKWCWYYCSLEERAADFCTLHGKLLGFCKLPKPQWDLLALVGGGWAATAQPCLTSDLVWLTEITIYSSRSVQITRRRARKFIHVLATFHKYKSLCLGFTSFTLKLFGFANFSSSLAFGVQSKMYVRPQRTKCWTIGHWMYVLCSCTSVLDQNVWKAVFWIC